MSEEEKVPTEVVAFRRRIGGTIRQYREAMGMAQGELARRVGKSVRLDKPRGYTDSFISLVESGQRQIALEDFAAIAQEVGQKMHVLLGEMPADRVPTAENLAVQKAARLGAVQGAEGVLERFEALDRFMSRFLAHPLSADILHDLFEQADTFDGDAGPTGGAN